MILNAGRSARKMKRDLQWETSLVRLVVLPLAIIVALSYGALHIRVPLASVVLVGGASAFVATVRGFAMLGTEEMKKKKKTMRNFGDGGKVELRQAFRIAWGLSWRAMLLRGWFVALHDRGLPESNANTDHIVVTRTGVKVVDSKRRLGEFRVRYGKLCYRSKHLNGPVDELLRTTMWEADHIRKALNRKFGKDVIPVQVFWAVDQTRPLRILEHKYVEDQRGQIELVHTEWFQDGIWVIDHVKTPHHCSRGNKILTRAQVREVGRYLDQKFPPMK